MPEPALLRAGPGSDLTLGEYPAGSMLLREVGDPMGSLAVSRARSMMPRRMDGLGLGLVGVVGDDESDESDLSINRK